MFFVCWVQVAGVIRKKAAVPNVQFLIKDSIIEMEY